MAKVADDDEKYDDNTSLPQKMKAIVCTEYGDPSKVLEIMHVDVPKPKDNEILIEIYAAALNPVDYKMVQGWMGMFVRKKFPWIPGRDFSGIVRFIGNTVNQNLLKKKNISIGSTVCGMVDHFRNNGTFCQYITVKIEYVELFNKNKVNFVESAALPLTTMTSYQSLINKGNLKENDNKILILGGSSGCGVYAIQIAKIYKIKEITVTSSQIDFCKSLGATKVINYKDKNEAIWYEQLKNEKYDMIYDCVGGKESWLKSADVLKKDGTFVTIVGDDKHGSAMTIKGLIGQGLSMTNRKFWSFFGNPGYTQFLMDACHGLDKIIKFVNNDQLKPILDDTSPYKFDDFVNMFKKQMSHTAHGKLVLEIKSFQNDDNNNINNDE